MFEGRFPFLAVKLLYDFGIIKLILKFPKSCEGNYYLTSYFSIELQDENKVDSLVFQSLKVSQVLGALLLQIYSQTNQDTGVGNLCHREYPGSSLSSDDATRDAFKEFIKNTFYSALMLPFISYEYKNKNKTEKVVVKVLQESLKKSNEVLKFVTGTAPFV